MLSQSFVPILRETDHEFDVLDLGLPTSEGTGDDDFSTMRAEVGRQDFCRL